MSDADPRTTEELQRIKLMLEIEKLQADIIQQNARFEMERRRDRWFLPLAFIGGGATLLAAAAGLGKLFFGG